VRTTRRRTRRRIVEDIDRLWSRKRSGHATGVPEDVFDVIRRPRYPCRCANAATEQSVDDKPLDVVRESSRPAMPKRGSARSIAVRARASGRSSAAWPQHERDAGVPCPMSRARTRRPADGRRSERSRAPSSKRPAATINCRRKCA
jgi:hypothetical protein